MKALFEAVPLGLTPLRVSRLGVGTTAIGGLYSPTSASSAEETLQAAWDTGVRFFDSAPQYGNGMAEQRLGAFLQGKPRDEYVVCTKVGRLLRVPDIPVADGYYKGTPPERPVFDFSYDGVMKSVEESLVRLGLDRIDVLHIHDPDNHYPQAIDGAYKALDRLRADGTIGAVGAGMNQSHMLAEFARNGDFDCFLLAGRYTLLEQGALTELLPLCVQKNISIIIGGVYNSGILANPSAGAKFNYEDADRAQIARALMLENVCLSHGVSLKAAAVQFPLAHPAVASVLTGPRTPAEMLENAELFRTPIPSALWRDLKAQGLIAADAPTA
ncbi:aldo/keto reductase [Pseudomonas yamanorum]|jgi:D-threo-aldose 1-dehydrogenase|uniref:Aldo/keto reductase n=1 Tax=Pseudomonas yamanorum TaxID=515393 RepID=A0A7Y8FBV4_9PSED|nr:MULTISPECIES: aldo/keto reductase [Pseudomonas]MCS3416496.1 D-threo-aldose 1-dehydrogenase [Pseudomonas sp. BIGb0558]MCS3435719.1 D-threo-aldose 1-dehydrogenase [Pseudomonas sp. BIGb0450]NWE41439.1 aldo/keto reductase [Pseudomonas yamanorum]NWE76507.1 aldo/keto reductase [Pseudomonas yamanorum]